MFVKWGGAVGPSCLVAVPEGHVALRCMNWTIASLSDAKGRNEHPMHLKNQGTVMTPRFAHCLTGSTVKESKPEPDEARLEQRDLARMSLPPRSNAGPNIQDEIGCAPIFSELQGLGAKLRGAFLNKQA